MDKVLLLKLEEELELIGREIDDNIKELLRLYRQVRVGELKAEMYYGDASQDE